jgi:hypothetical protein
MDKDNSLPPEKQEFNFSFFKEPITNCKPEPEPVTLERIIDLIIGPNLKEKTEKIRQEPNKDRRNMLKKVLLPYVTFSGIFTERRNDALINHSGLICCDLDHLEDLDEARQKILNSLTPALLFRSPSGDGLKIILAIDTSLRTHDDFFSAIHSYFATDLKLKLDNTPDVSRACFLCHDPEAYYATNPVLLDQKFLDTFLDDPAVAVTPDTAGGPPIKIMQTNALIPDELYKRGKQWVESRETFVEGNRHHFISALAGFLCRTGMEKSLAENFLMEFERPGFGRKEILGVVNRLYKNPRYYRKAPLKQRDYQKDYVDFPLRLLWVPQDQFNSRIMEILESSYEWQGKDIPTSIKRNYLNDVRDGKLDPELFLLLAAVKSIIGKQNFTRTTLVFLVKRMFGDVPWRKPTRYWLDKLIETAMIKGMMSKVACRHGCRGFYITIRYKPEDLSRKVIEQMAIRKEKIRTVKAAGLKVAEYKKQEHKPGEEFLLKRNQFLKAI